MKRCEPIDVFVFFPCCLSQKPSRSNVQYIINIILITTIIIYTIIQYTHHIYIIYIYPVSSQEKQRRFCSRLSRVRTKKTALPADARGFVNAAKRSTAPARGGKQGGSLLVVRWNQGNPSYPPQSYPPQSYPPPGIRG